LDAKAEVPGVTSFAGLLGRITGLQEVASGFACDTGRSSARLRALFFDFLRQAGKVWLVVENAEEVLAAPSVDGANADFRKLLSSWCKAGHEAKLLLLTRHAVHPAPECHRSLRDVENALLGGLPEDAAIELLRQRLVNTRFRSTGDLLLRQIAQRLHRVPMALEQFAGYLHWNEQGIELDQRFLDQNDLLSLCASEQMEALLLRVIEETLRLLDAASLSILGVIAWAGIPVPFSALVGIEEDGAGLLTRLVRSSLLLAREGTTAEGRSFDMHPLIRDALRDASVIPLDFGRIARICRTAGYSEWEKNQLRPALSLYVLQERAARAIHQRDELAAAIMSQGKALHDLSRLEEALAAYDESISIYRALVDNEHRQELRRELARAIQNRSTTLRELGRHEEAVVANDESIAICRALVEDEHRRDFREDLAISMMGRGSVLKELGRREEAVVADDESIAIFRVLVENEHRREFRGDMAKGINNRGNALRELGRLEEALAAYDESMAICHVLVEDEHRLELRNDLARQYYNVALAREKQEDVVAALAAVRRARLLWEDLAKEGMHLERDLAMAAKAMEARLS
jgi:tetratricopeptide (TPR) repeat protein